VDAACAAFGPDRLMFGSDWPMSARVMPYAEVVEGTGVLVDRLTAEEQRSVWAGTARRVYGI
jgi:L-fuconolactonase